MPASAPADSRTPGAHALVERLAEEMAARWHRGERPLVEDYLALHPGLREVPEAALELLSEEICLRQEAGQEPDPADLVRRFPHWDRQVRALLECHRLLAARPAPPRFPAPGETLGEFHLLAEIGRGAYARVFLARQPALADRRVVLKLGPHATQEHSSLARLQHTHIVPLYSVHDFPERALRALCMPYFGGATLAQLLEAMPRPPARRTGRDLLEALDRAQQAMNAECSGIPHSAFHTPHSTGPALRFLARASYAQAVCWLGTCLADALHYAHERGILHLDLKPSNVLLAADGTPMLLDFHLAREPLPAGVAAPAWLGGTPGCMAPEHQAALAAVAEGRPVPAPVDGRADVYSLGRLLGELLGGRNSAVSSDLTALLNRCLAPDPARRYPTAADLAADLRRHLADLPLRGVPGWRPLERWRKWRTRRPHGLPVLLLLAGALAATCSLAAHVRRQQEDARAALREGRAHIGRHGYGEALDCFRRGAALARDLPFAAGLRRELHEHERLAERARAAEALHSFCERIRPLYGAGPLPPAHARAAADHCARLWDERESLLRCLEGQPDPALREQVRADLLDLALIRAHLGVRLAPPGNTAGARRAALDLLGRAERELGPSCVLYQERRAHALALGLTGLAEDSSARAEALPPATPWEHDALGRAFFLAGDYRRALRELDRSLALRPGALWPTFYKGCCACRTGDYEGAVAAFSACQALAPDLAWCAYNRGLAYLELGRLDRALPDLGRALLLDPAFAPAALARGTLHYRAGDFEKALADLERARAGGLDTPAVHYNLALVHLARKAPGPALASVRRALEQDPRHEPAGRLLERLRPEK